jgi:hypothetical protein
LEQILEGRPIRRNFKEEETTTRPLGQPRVRGADIDFGLSMDDRAISRKSGQELQGVVADRQRWKPEKNRRIGTHSPEANGRISTLMEPNPHESHIMVGLHRQQRCIHGRVDEVALAVPATRRKTNRPEPEGTRNANAQLE